MWEIEQALTEEQLNQRMTPEPEQTLVSRYGLVYAFLGMARQLTREMIVRLPREHLCAVFEATDAICAVCLTEIKRRGKESAEKV